MNGGRLKEQARKEASSVSDKIVAADSEPALRFVFDYANKTTNRQNVL